MMTEENIDETQETESEEEIQEEVQLDSETQRAMRDGWTDKSKWDDSGKNSDDWVSAKKFNERGQMMGDIRHLKRENDNLRNDVDSRLDNQRKYLETQNKMIIQDLEFKRKEAIEDADVENAERIQNQIDTIKQPQAAAPQVEKGVLSDDDKSLIDDFNSNNAWVMENSPKTTWMKEKFTEYFQNPRFTTQQAIDQAKLDVDRDFPSINPRRNEAVAVEGSRSKPGRKQEKKLSWGDLTSDELRMHKEMGSSNFTQNEFLQMVKDSRSDS